MQKNIEIPGAHLLLDIPEAGTETVILFIPGVSGKGRSDRFLPLVHMAMEMSYALARVDMWESEDLLKGLTLAHIFGTLDGVCETLSEEGYSRIIAIGKSFGGGIILAYNSPLIVAKIGWAPAFSLTSGDGNISVLREKTLGSIASVRDIVLGTQCIAQFSGSIGVVHGTEDTVVPLQNSKDIIVAASRGSLIEIPHADHSFKTPEEEQALIDATKHLIQ